MFSWVKTVRKDSAWKACRLREREGGKGEGERVQMVQWSTFLGSAATMHVFRQPIEHMTFAITNSYYIRR